VWAALVAGAGGGGGGKGGGEEEEEEGGEEDAAGVEAAAAAFEAARREIRSRLEAALDAEIKARALRRKGRVDAIYSQLKGSRKTSNDRTNLLNRAKAQVTREEEKECEDHPALSALQTGEVLLLIALRCSLRDGFSVALGDALSKGCPAGAPLDKFGNTPLHACAHYEALEELRIVLSLLSGVELHAALRARNSDGKTPVDLAESGGAVHAELSRAAADSTTAHDGQPSSPQGVGALWGWWGMAAGVWLVSEVWSSPVSSNPLGPLVSAWAATLHTITTLLLNIFGALFACVLLLFVLLFARLVWSGLEQERLRMEWEHLAREMCQTPQGRRTVQTMVQEAQRQHRVARDATDNMAAAERREAIAAQAQKQKEEWAEVARAQLQALQGPEQQLARRHGRS